MGRQKKIAKEIIEADADYVLALKGNQEKVHEEVKSFLDSTLEKQKKKRPLLQGTPNGGKRSRCVCPGKFPLSPAQKSVIFFTDEKARGPNAQSPEKMIGTRIVEKHRPK